MDGYITLNSSIFGGMMRQRCMKLEEEKEEALRWLMCMSGGSGFHLRKTNKGKDTFSSTYSAVGTSLKHDENQSKSNASPNALYLFHHRHGETAAPANDFMMGRKDALASSGASSTLV